MRFSREEILEQLKGEPTHQILSSIVTDARTPLNILQGYCALLSDDTDPLPLEDALPGIQKSVEQLFEVFEIIKDYALYLGEQDKND